MTLSLPGFIEAPAARYQDLATAAGEMIGQTHRVLASMVRPTQAQDPVTALDRLAALDDSRLCDLGAARTSWGHSSERAKLYAKP